MSNVWVYRADGTLQCGMGKEEPLARAQEALETIVGKVISGEKRGLPLFIIACCGAPTGFANCFEISQSQAELLFCGIMGPMGFRLWDFGVTERPTVMSAPGETPVPFGQGMTSLASALTSAARNPVLVRELLGWNVRVYKRGDALTKDYRRDRVNLEVSADGRIVDIGFF